MEMSVSHLRLLPSPPPQMTADEACLDAFQRELDYVHRTLRRLGTAPSEVDDLAQEVFLALHGCWATYDPTVDSKEERKLAGQIKGPAGKLAGQIKTVEDKAKEKEAAAPAPAAA